MNRTIIDQPSLVSCRAATSLHLTVTELPRKDGMSLLAFDQPALNRCALDEPDRVVLDEAAQLTLYKRLHTKFAAQPSPFIDAALVEAASPNRPY